jgi:streptogramin lyase
MKKILPLLALIGALQFQASAVAAPPAMTVLAPAPYSIDTYAGSGTNASLDSTNPAFAGFASPAWVAADAKGNVYVGDQGTKLIRKIDASGAVTTLAGTNAGDFNSVNGVAVDQKGNLFVADGKSRVIRKIGTNGVVSVFAGIGGEFSVPLGVATDAKGNVYVADSDWGIVSKISPAGVVKTLAGTNGEFASLVGIAVDGKGEIFVSDYVRHLVSKISPGGVVKTLAGNGSGYADAKGTNAQFGSLEGIAADAVGNVFVSDFGNNVIRKINPQGVVTTVAGNGAPQYNDGMGTNAQLMNTYGIAVGPKGNIFFADASNDVIREGVPAKTHKIVFPAIAPQVFGGAPFPLNATATSQLPVNYSTTDTNLISISGNMVTINGAGTATITASQPGDTTFSAAADVSRQVVIVPATQTISVGNFTNTISQTLTVFLSCTSGATPSATSSSANIELSAVSPKGGNLSITGKALGNAIITITAPATANFKKATKALPVKVIQVMPANG